MARRFAASLLVLVAMGLALVGPVLAADPDDLGRPPISRPEPPEGTGASPKVHTDRSAQSAPGANGRIALNRPFLAAFPGAIYTVEPDGSDPFLVSEGASFGSGDLWPAYSPGGTMIAVARDMTFDATSVDGDIVVIKANGSGIPRRLTTTATSDEDPDWTPDGGRIVFTSYRTGNGDIYSMTIEGKDVRRLTTHAAFDGFPSVSPDGKKIAFASTRAGNLAIYSMNMDGSGVMRLTDGAHDEYQPDWSPDGTMIAFSSTMPGEPDIFVMKADGSDVENLTNDPAYSDMEPSWSPDGAQIAFWSFADADTDIYVMAATGGTQTAIWSTVEDEWSPSWQPIPEFPLVDARFSTFENDIEWVYAEGITVGCSAERYCPDDPVTREQMAIFLDRALDLPTTTTDYFTDDTGRTGEAAINRLRAANITLGCSPGNYCPTDKVSRGQMASFLARAFALPATTTDYFSDDAGTTHEANINKVKAAGITSGCSPTTYCPTADVTRGQMAAFLRRALED